MALSPVLPITGEIKRVGPVDVAVGQWFNFTTDSNEFVLLEYVAALLSTSSTTVNRQVTLYIYDSTNTVWCEVTPPLRQGPSVIYKYTFGLNMVAYNDGDGVRSYAPLPLIILPPSSRITLAAYNFQSGDQFKAVTIVYQSWLIP